MSECIYKEMQKAKNGSLVPVFQNGRTLFSLYNPERDADSFYNAHKEAFDNAGCILVGGIGNGLHLKVLSEHYPKACIIAFEADESSLAFSKAHFSDYPENVFLTEMGQLNNILPEKYLPAVHGNFSFAAIRSWSDFMGNQMSDLLSLINSIISNISADYSVQAQFGKLWHRNILLNLSHYDAMNENQIFDFGSFSVQNRKAAIVGAGPSLDKSIVTLSEHRNEFCVFATDTSFNTLKSAGITPDFVVTVDSQQISEKHFIGHNLNETVIAADLTSNSSIIQTALNQNCKILLFHNNHPLSLLIENWFSSINKTECPFPLIDSGAGTVLHAATDLSRKMGFTELVFFGADFSYSNGKPYTKGTYLEKQYYAEELRTHSTETSYSTLTYRTPLIPISNDSFTTEVLTRYRKALDKYLRHDFPVIIHSLNKVFPFKMTDFIPWYIEKLQKKDEKVFFSLLPLAAWYKKNNLNADIECVYTFAEQQTANVWRIQCRQLKN